MSSELEMLLLIGNFHFFLFPIKIQNTVESERLTPRMTRKNGSHQP